MAVSIHILPPEILVMIMSLVDSLHDLWSLIQASPDVLSCFNANRQRVLQPYIGSLTTAFGGPVHPSALLAVHLRYIRSRFSCAGNIKPLQEYIRLVLHIFLPLEEVKTHWPTKIPILSALLELALEAEWVISDYSTQAWEKMQDSLETRDFRWIVEPFPRKTLQLSVAERRSFQDAIFRYESYCQAFFRDQDFLFEGDETLRSMLLSQPPCPPKLHASTATARFYSIVSYIYNQHCSIFRNVADSLGALAIPQHGQTEATGTARAHLDDARFSDDTRIQRQICRLKHRSQLEAHKYVHYLTSQGFGILLALQRMDIEAQRGFTLSTFFQVSQSGSPVVLLVNQVDQYRKGIVGCDRWMPWVDSEGVSRNGWQLAECFWSSERLSLA
ncbi:hypothetical protein ACJZ2D_009388 [Fusarium nematophilum]